MTLTKAVNIALNTSRMTTVHNSWAHRHYTYTNYTFSFLVVSLPPITDVHAIYGLTWNYIQNYRTTYKLYTYSIMLYVCLVGNSSILVEEIVSKYVRNFQIIPFTSFAYYIQWNKFNARWYKPWHCLPTIDPWLYVNNGCDEFEI